MDEFSQHEALDRAFLMNEFFDNHLAQHPFIKANPALASRCENIARHLGDLYQAVGCADDQHGSPETAKTSQSADIMDAALCAIVAQQVAERDFITPTILAALSDAMPWGLVVDLGNGQSAELIKLGESKPTDYRPRAFIFDFRLVNCDQDHIEVTTSITGGGGSV